MTDQKQTAALYNAHAQHDVDIVKTHQGNHFAIQPLRASRGSESGAYTRCERAEAEWFSYSPVVTLADQTTLADVLGVNQAFAGRYASRNELITLLNMPGAAEDILLMDEWMSTRIAEARAEFDAGTIRHNQRDLVHAVGQLVSDYQTVVDRESQLNAALSEMGQRIASGYADQPEVRRHARSVQRDLVEPLPAELRSLQRDTNRVRIACNRYSELKAGTLSLAFGELGKQVVRQAQQAEQQGSAGEDQKRLMQRLRERANVSRQNADRKGQSSIMDDACVEIVERLIANKENISPRADPETGPASTYHVGGP